MPLSAGDLGAADAVPLSVKLPVATPETGTLNATLQETDAAFVGFDAASVIALARAEVTVRLAAPLAAAS